MKHLLFMLGLFLTFAGNSQCTRPEGGNSFLLGLNAGTTSYKELVTGVEVSYLKNHPSWYVSLVGDIYTSKNPTYAKYTTAAISGRFNLVFLKNDEHNRGVAYLGYGYVTQGHERPYAMNKWSQTSGVSYLRLLKFTEQYDAWLRGNAYYMSGINRFFFTLGLQSNF